MDFPYQKSSAPRGCPQDPYNAEGSKHLADCVLQLETVIDKVKFEQASNHGCVCVSINPACFFRTLMLVGLSDVRILTTPDVRILMSPDVCGGWWCNCLIYNG